MKKADSDEFDWDHFDWRRAVWLNPPAMPRSAKETEGGMQRSFRDLMDAYTASLTFPDADEGVEIVYHCRECPMRGYTPSRCGFLTPECLHPECLHPDGIDLRKERDSQKIPRKCPLRGGSLTVVLAPRSEIKFSK